MRWTRMPGVWTASGSMAPAGSTSSSSYTITARAAMAITGLKFRCASR